MAGKIQRIGENGTARGVGRSSGRDGGDGYSYGRVIDNAFFDDRPYRTSNAKFSGYADEDDYEDSRGDSRGDYGYDRRQVGSGGGGAGAYDQFGNRDPYAGLRQGAAARNQRLAREEVGYDDPRDVRTSRRKATSSRREKDYGGDWEESYDGRPAQRLNNDYGNWDDVRDGREAEYDRHGRRIASRRGERDERGNLIERYELETDNISDKLVRRSMYGQGEQDNYRGNPADFFKTKNDQYGLARGGSIFGMTVEDAVDALAEDSGMFDKVDPEQRRANKVAAEFGGMARRASREKQQILSRAHPMILGRAGQHINRIGNEYDMDRHPMGRNASRNAPRFGEFDDMRRINDEEIARARMWNEQSAARVMPKKNHLTREDRRDIWEMEARDKAHGKQAQYQDTYNLTFADSLGRSFGGGGGGGVDQGRKARHQMRTTDWGV